MYFKKFEFEINCGQKDYTVHKFEAAGRNGTGNLKYGETILILN